MGGGGYCTPHIDFSPFNGGYIGGGVTCYFCFCKDTKVTVLNGSKQSKKLISEIKEDDLVLTFNGTDKIFTKVSKFKKNEGIFEFYIFKVKDEKLNTKNISVTGNHTMIIFGRDIRIGLIIIILKIDLTEKERSQILYENASKLLKLD